MKLFPSGVVFKNTEHLCLLHMASDIEQWLLNEISRKANTRRDAMIDRWRPVFFADPAVKTIPTDKKEFVANILARPEYRNRTQVDAEHTLPQAGGGPRTPKPVTNKAKNKAKYDAQPRTTDTVTLYQGAGLTISDADRDTMLDDLFDLEDWVLGALLGKANKGKLEMFKEWKDKLEADPNVTEIPANDDDLILMITARPDYMTLPAQIAEGEEQRRKEHQWE